ncbi:uncharacterized membrane protein-like [Eurosta solidaginis]|uniref:uncharacterized membrane protein-like n=1 Tax=Eurosta solidaginis TaxID=178769 RepID=UPI0035316626
MQCSQWCVVIFLVTVLQTCAAFPLGKRIAASARQFDNSQLDDYGIDDAYENIDIDDKEVKNKFGREDNDNSLENADYDYTEDYYDYNDYDNDLDNEDGLDLGIHGENDKNSDLESDDEYNENGLESDYSAPFSSSIYST